MKAECLKCGYQWESRVKEPKSCPRCKSRLDAPKKAIDMDTISGRLEYLRGEIESERISYGEIAELQSLARYIDPSDTLLLEWAGVPEK